MARNSSSLINPAAATSTSAPRVAWGMRPISGARKSRVTATTPAVTASASWDTGAGLVVDRRLRGAAAGRIGLEEAAAEVGRAQGQKLLVGIQRRVVVPGKRPAPAAIDSTKDIRAMPSAPGHRSRDQ